MRLCPKDFKPCIDDLCYGGGCIRGGGEMLEVCQRCGQWFSHEFDIECKCDREPSDFEDDFEDE